jgi:CRP-like cAMP-binding protein
VLDPTRCLVIDPRTLEEMVAKNSEISLRLIKKLAKRLDSADTLIEVLLHRDPKARVLLALSRHAEAFGEETPEGVRVRTTARELADEVAVDPRLAHDMMVRVGRLGIAREEDGTIIVTDVSRIHDFIEFLEIPNQNDPASMPPGTPSGSGLPPGSNG